MKILGLTCLLAVLGTAPALAGPAVYTSQSRVQAAEWESRTAQRVHLGGRRVGHRRNAALRRRLECDLARNVRGGRRLGRRPYLSPAGVSVQQVAYHRMFRNIMGDSGTTRYFWGPSGSGSGEHCEFSDPQATLCSTTAVSSPIDRPSIASWQGAIRAAGATTSSGDGSVTVDEIAVTYLDESAPSFSSAPAGDLLSTEAIDGTRTVTFEVRDTGGGVYQAALVIDGVELPRVVVDVNDGRCAVPFIDPVPCKLVTRGSADPPTPRRSRTVPTT